MASTACKITDIPHEFICCITGEIIRDPVSTVDGNTYERAAILQWFDTGRITSPLTGAALGSRMIIPNLALKRAIAEFLERVPVLKHASGELQELKNLKTAVALRESDLRQWKENTLTANQHQAVLHQLARSKQELQLLRSKEFLERKTAITLRDDLRQWKENTVTTNQHQAVLHQLGRSKQELQLLRKENERLKEMLQFILSAANNTRSSTSDIQAYVAAALAVEAAVGNTAAAAAQRIGNDSFDPAPAPQPVPIKKGEDGWGMYGPEAT